MRRLEKTMLWSWIQYRWAFIGHKFGFVSTAGSLNALQDVAGWGGSTAGGEGGREMFTLVWHGLKLWATQFREINSQWAHLHSSHHTRTRPLGDMVEFKCSVLLLDIGAIIHIRLFSWWKHFLKHISLSKRIKKNVLTIIWGRYIDILLLCNFLQIFSYLNHHKWNLKARKLYLRVLNMSYSPFFILDDLLAVFEDLYIYIYRSLFCLQQPCMDEDLSKDAWRLIAAYLSLCLQPPTKCLVLASC